MGAIEIIVAALASGAAAGLKPTVAQAVKDAYAGLKGWLGSRYGAVDVSPLEKKPESEAKRASVAEDLTDAGAGEDAEALQLAQKLLDAIAQHAPEAAGSVGVDLEKVRARSLKVGDVDATGSGVRVRESDFAGDIEIGNVRAGERGDPPKKA